MDRFQRTRRHESSSTIAGSASETEGTQVQVPGNLGVRGIYAAVLAVAGHQGTAVGRP